MEKLITTKILRYAKKIKAIKLLGGECRKCGNKNIFQLSFHHINDNKEINISKLLKGSKWVDLEKEVMKCELLCHNCHSELHMSNKVNKRFYNIKNILLEWKGEYSCCKCGYNKCNSSLHFHHKNNKSFGIAIITKRKTKNTLEKLKDKIIDEINKCSIICANCHFESHSDVEFFEENKKEIYEKSKNIKDGNSKLDRKKIKKLYENGMRQVDIAKHFKASKGTISNIIKELKL